jgi:hypothetical protein
MVMNLEESGTHGLRKPVELNPVADGIMVGAEFSIEFSAFTECSAFFRQRAKPKKNQQENVMRIS